MALTLDVRADVRQVEKMLGKLEGNTGRRTIARAINDTARSAQSRSIKEVAKDINLPRKFVAKRFNIRGEVKAERSRITKANVGRLTADLTVYMRGIPVFQVANKAPPVGKQRKGGVKAKGGRFYKGAFYAPHWGTTKVFKRTSPKRYPVMLPKIGVRKRLDTKYKKYTIGPSGISTFRKNYERHISLVLRRLNG